MADQKLGLAAAVELAMAQAEPEAEPEQLPLMALAPVAEPGGKPAEGARGPGRPAGARNKSTQDLAKHILANYRSPLIFLAEAYSRPVEDLQKALACKRIEAFKLQLDAAEKLAPYLHSKQPIGLDVTKRSDFTLTIVEPGEGEQGLAEGEDVILIEGEIMDGKSEENQ